MAEALVLIDLQQDYLAAPGLSPHRGPLVERAARLLRGCRARGVPVIHVWTTVHTDPDDRMPHWQRADLTRCLAGTPGHATPADLAPLPGEPVVHKRFFSAFEGGDLDAALQLRGVDQLWLAGLHLHACVRSTAIDAYARGYTVSVARDAVASDDPVHAAITRRYLADRCARFVDVEALLNPTDAAPRGPSARRSFAHLAPADGARAWDLPVTADVDEVARRAREAGPAWAAAPAEERRAVLSRLADRLAEEAEPLAARLVRDVGKPITLARREVELAARFLRATCDGALPPDPPEVRRRPLGAVALVTPFNNPLAVPLGKLGPAVAYGNTVAWKPAPAGSAIAVEALRLLREAGLPEGVITLALGGREEAAALMASPHIDAVSLTGGAEAGAAALELCARRMIPLQAELGGNNATIVWEDADLPAAAAAVTLAAFGFAGQRCTAGRRVIVAAARYEAFVPHLERAMAGLAWGDPARPETVVGPLISAEARDRVAAAVRRADAPLVLAPHGPGPAAGWYHPPVALGGLPPDHELVQEETFGPVLVLQRARDLDEALALSNGVRHGLVAALFSTDPAVQDTFLDRARAGVLQLNRATTDVSPHLPFGGWKASGVGPPEHGEGDRAFYTRMQAVYGR